MLLENTGKVTFIKQWTFKKIWNTNAVAASPGKQPQHKLRLVKVLDKIGCQGHKNKARETIIDSIQQQIVHQACCRPPPRWCIPRIIRDLSQYGPHKKGFPRHPRVSLRRLSLNQKQVQRCDLKGNYDGAFALWDETKEGPKKKKNAAWWDCTHLMWICWSPGEDYGGLRLK